ncbi:MAG TPA: glycosyltransferase family 9 protein [Sumerlaeia bacterium]|nr:glycosyltransferase family 9 protein [Sumerlaeia bacterium]
MRVDTLRKIDRWIGIPVCLGLTCIEKVLRRTPSDRAPRNVLVIQLSEMGSLALAYPSIRHLKQLWPEARVHFLAFKRNRQFLELLDLVDDEDIWTLDDSSPGAFLTSSWKFFRKARQRPIDTTLDYEIFSRASAILAYLSGARRRAGFHNYRAEGLYRGGLLTHPVFYNVYKHIAVNFSAMVRAVAARPAGGVEQPALKEVVGPGGRVDLDLTLPKRHVPPERADAMRRRIARAYPGLSSGTRIVLLSPFSGNLLPIRAWPAERYATFTRGLFERTQDTIALIMGLPEARDYCRPIFEKVPSPRLVDFIGQTKDIAEVIELVSVSHLFVTSDSGPPHFASLTNVPTIVMFGPECPMLYGPLGENVRTVFLGMSCSPCVSAFNHRDTPCRNNRCMKEIRPEGILEMALDLLRRGL